MPTAGEATVVVCTYDERRWDDLVACLDSLECQTAPPLETIVVVDHNPALLARAERAFPAARVIASQRPRGLAGARNAGIDDAAGSLVAFIDDDARAEPQWLERLATCFDEPQVVGAGGALLPLWEGPEPRWLPPEFYWVVGCSYTGLPRERAPVRNPIGANMAVRAAALTAAGGFREGAGEETPRELRARGVVRAAGNVPDDTDLAIRVSRLHPGAVWLYEPAARVLHRVGRERATLGYFLRRSYEEGVGKAGLTRYIGAGEGLSAERRQLARVLPRGFARALRQLLGGDPGGGLRALALLVGVLSTGTGFLLATIGGLPGRRATER